MRLACHVVGLMAMLGYLHGAPVPITITQDWSGRFQGDLNLPITEEVNGWEVKLNFSSPVTMIDVSFVPVLQYLITAKQR